VVAFTGLSSGPRGTGLTVGRNYLTHDFGGDFADANPVMNAALPGWFYAACHSLG